MPDLINPTFDTKIDQPDIPVVVDTQWNRPTVQIPDSLKQSQALFQEPGDVSLMDFTNKVNNHLTPDQVKRNNEDANIMASLTPKITTPSKEVPFRYFSSIDAMRYKQNSRLWNTQGYNPEVPSDITDAIYDFHETKWESIKNILPKLWSTTAFSFKNYFAEYADTARAISQLDANLLHDSQRFEDYQNDQNELEALNPDYKTDKEVKWWQLGRGDYWEQSASSLGFTIGTIAAAVTENVGITLATGGLGEFGELYNSPRKIYKAISDYYSLKRAYSLVKGALGAKSLVGRLGNAANIWRLTNGALSEAAFEGATIAYDYLQSYKQNYIDKYGRNPSEEEMKGAKMAANSMANATILFETPFLMASNAVQFGNLIAPKTIGKLAKLGEKGAFKLGTELIDGLPKTIVQSTENQAKNIFTKYGEKGLHAIKNATWEGTEESYQALVTTSTQKYYGDKYKNGDDGDIMKALGAGYDYITSNQGLIEFSAGFATGEIFHLAGVPLHIFAKPSVRTAEEQATYKKANPDATDIDAKYKTNVLNNVFGYGMDKINKEREKANLEEIAKKLNSVDLEKFLKEEGFLSLVKDKQTQFALAKYLQNNDQFNMQNAQNLQLNRYLYAGLTTGKIDLQIDKLKQFASQDFHTLSEFFGLDENDYSTQEDKDKFINGFRAWTAELGNKTKEFERIFNQQKDSFSSIISAAAKEHDKNLSIKNSFLTDLQRKYSEDNIENLSKKISSDEITQLNDMNVATVASHFRFYAVNEAVKASVFSQVGMDDAANRAKDIVRQLVKNDSTHTFYHELGSFFDIGYRENRLKDLQSKVDLAKSSNDENLSLYEQQLNSFKSMTKKLDGQFNRASNYNIDSVANSILDYLHNTQRELNNLDNSTSLEDRIANQEVGQYSLLKEFVKLQKSHQENLNLYNYLSSQANREDYTRFQSRKLTDFFSKAVELTDNEEKDKQVKEAVDNNGVQEAEVVKSYVKKTEEPIQVSNTLSENTKVESKPKYNIDNVNALILAIIQKNFQKISDLKSEIAKIPKDLVEERVNLLISRVATYKKPENANKIKEEFRRIFGEDFLQNSPTPKVEEKPAVKQPSTNPLDKIKITLTPQEDKRADIERRRQEELNQKTDAGYSIIALDYLFTGGRDVIQSTDYLLQALVGGFTSAAKEINDIRNKYADKLGNIKDDINSDVYNQMMLEIRDVINKNYNDPKANEIFDKILKNATGFTTREGNQTSIELDKLNEQNDSKINAKYYAELAALGATTTTSIKPGVEELFDENPELANAVYSKILTNSGLSSENLLSLLLKDNLIEKQCP